MVCTDCWIIAGSTCSSCGTAPSEKYSFLAAYYKRKGGYNYIKYKPTTKNFEQFDVASAYPFTLTRQPILKQVWYMRIIKWFKGL